MKRNLKINKNKKLFKNACGLLGVHSKNYLSASEMTHLRHLVHIKQLDFGRHKLSV